MFDEDKFEVAFAAGDLLAAPVEGVVVNVNERMNLNYALARQLTARTGPDLPARLLAYVDAQGGGPFLEGAVTSLDTDRLPPPIKRVVFVVWWTGDNEYSENLIFKCLANAIREADRHGLTSLAVPLFGRGHRLAFPVIAGGIRRAVNELHGIKKPLSPERLVFMSSKPIEIDALREVMAQPDYRLEVG